MSSETHELGREFDSKVYAEKYFIGGFDAGVSGYDDYKNCQEIVEKQFEIIDQVMKGRVGTKTHLDVGCAYGFSVNKMRQSGWESSGFDVSEFAIAEAKKLFGEGFWVGDALKPWEPIGAGLVTATEFFEHLPSDKSIELIKTLSERAEWGCFLINARVFPGEDIHKIDADEGHLTFHNLSWWVHQFAQYGEIDWNAMYELNKLSEEVADVFWVNRYVVVKFG